MAVKYRLEFNTRLRNSYRVDISNDSYTGDVLALVGAMPNPLIINWNGNNGDNPHEAHVVPSNAVLNVYNDNLDIDELQLISDQSFKLQIYRENILYWQGYLISDGIQKRTGRFQVTLTAIDGLELADNSIYKQYDNYGVITVNGVESVPRCPMNAIRLLFNRRENVNNALPIRWNTSLYPMNLPNDDMLAGRTRIDPDGDLSSKDKSNMWWLENICKSSYSWVYQRDAHWILNNYKDLIQENGIFNGYGITESIGAQTATVITDDLNDTTTQYIGDDRFWITKKPLGSVKVEYEDLKFKDDNAIPNGGFDSIVGGRPQFWYSKKGSAFVTYEPPINNRFKGYSVMVNNRFITSTELDYFTFGTIPLDFNILYQTATFGFTWVAREGFEVENDGTGNLKQNQLRAIVKYTGYQSGVFKELYLNDFGYWVDKNAPANAQVISKGWNGAPINWYFVHFDTSKSFFPNDEVVIHIFRGGNLELYNIVFTQTMDVNSGVNYIVSQIPNSQKANTPDGALVIKDVTSDSPLNQAYTKRSANGLEILFPYDQTKINDIIEIQFQSKGNANGIKLPDCGVLDANRNLNAGKLSIEFISPYGCIYQLDDVYFKVENNHDIYDISIPNSKNGKEDYKLEISSGFSGNMVTSYGNRFDTVDQSMLWTGNKRLTQIYGENILNWRNKPCRIFTGTIDKEVKFGSLVDIEGIKYIPLSIEYDCHNHTTELTAFEIRFDDLSFEVKHSSSGDN